MRIVTGTALAALLSGAALAGAPAEAPLPPQKPVVSDERRAIAARLDEILESAAARRVLGAEDRPVETSPPEDPSPAASEAEATATSDAPAPQEPSVAPTPDATAALAMDGLSVVRCREGAPEAVPVALPAIDRALARGALGVEAGAAPAAPPARRDLGAPALARVFDDLTLACDLVERTAALVADWAAVGGPIAGPVEEGALDRLAAVPAWDGWREAVVALAPDLAGLLIARLSGGFLAEDRLAPVLLLATLSPEAVAPDGLTAAGLALAEGRRADALALFGRLARRDDDDGQLAAVLLAERLVPGRDGPMPGGWLAHLEILGAIATEHAGRPIARRAALAEVRLGTSVLGPAAGLRTLSLAHRRGILDAATVEAVAPTVWEIPYAGAGDETPVADPAVWAAAEPESFEAVPTAPSDGGTDASAGAVAGSMTAPAAAPDAATHRDPDWRGRVSHGGTEGGADEREETAEAGVAAQPAAPAGTIPSPGSVPASVTPVLPPEAGVAAEIEAFLRVLDAEIADIERRLDDG